MRLPVDKLSDVPEPFVDDVIRVNGQWWVEAYPPSFVRTKNALLRSQETYTDALKSLFNDMLAAQRRGEFLVVFDENEELEDPKEWCKKNCRHRFIVVRTTDVQPCALFTDSLDATKFKLFFG